MNVCAISSHIYFFGASSYSTDTTFLFKKKLKKWQVNSLACSGHNRKASICGMCALITREDVQCANSTEVTQANAYAKWAIQSRSLKSVRKTQLVSLLYYN